MVSTSWYSVTSPSLSWYQFYFLPQQWAHCCLCTCTTHPHPLIERRNDHQNGDQLQQDSWLQILHMTHICSGITRSWSFVSISCNWQQWTSALYHTCLPACRELSQSFCHNRKGLPGIYQWHRLEWVVFLCLQCTCLLLSLVSAQLCWSIHWLSSLPGKSDKYWSVCWNCHLWGEWRWHIYQHGTSLLPSRQLHKKPPLIFLLNPCKVWDTSEYQCYLLLCHLMW